MKTNLAIFRPVLKKKHLDWNLFLQNSDRQSLSSCTAGFSTIASMLQTDGNGEIMTFKRQDPPPGQQILLPFIAWGWNQPTQCKILICNTWQNQSMSIATKSSHPEQFPFMFVCVWHITYWMRCTAQSRAVLNNMSHHHPNQAQCNASYRVFFYTGPPIKVKVWKTKVRWIYGDVDRPRYT